MSIERIKARVILLKKLISALKEIEDSGVKQPLELLKRALKEKANLEIEKSRRKKPAINPPNILSILQKYYNYY
ncbi:MAG: hypothetical protein WCA42_18475 [Desulfobacterales bacterium]